MVHKTKKMRQCPQTEGGDLGARLSINSEVNLASCTDIPSYNVVV